MGTMTPPTPSEIRRETDRRLRRLQLNLGDDLTRIRLDANVSIKALGRAAAIDDAYIGRIEAGTARPSLEGLAALGVALGADLSVRYFPGSGQRIHDRFQAPMLEALLRILDPRWRAELEVPIAQPARGVIDTALRSTLRGHPRSRSPLGAAAARAADPVGTREGGGAPRP